MKKGRSHDKKKMVMVGVEIDYPNDDGSLVMKRAAAQILEDYSAGSISDGLNKMVEETALITTDGWSAYPKAVGDRWYEIILSEQGANFPHLHWHIFNLKNWLRGIHHSVSTQHISAYLDEFNFRFNKRNHKNRLNSLLAQMVKLHWKPRIELRAN